MWLRRIFDWRRWRRTRAIFTDPWRSHVRLSLLRRGPLDLVFRTGGKMTVERPRSFRPVLEVLLSGRDSPLPVSWTDGRVHFQFQGQRLALRPDTHDAYVFREVFLDDCYGLDELVATGACEGEPPLDTVVDLGANIGLFSLRAAGLARRVIAVEPISVNRETARRNLSRYLANGRVRLVAAAIDGGAAASTRIHLSGNSGGHSIAVAHAAAFGTFGYEEVPCLSLAELFARQHVDRCSLLKCDVEGAEYDIFGAAPIELLRRIDQIVLEVHVDRETLLPERLDALVGRLQQAGFYVTAPQLDLHAARQVHLLRATRPEPSEQRATAA
ncbi:MAG: FkbM family methyltransferase [Pirellulales bacterium]|nr:FkbM family methyltransferase [Pirellulales bacterium]